MRTLKLVVLGVAVLGAAALVFDGGAAQALSRGPFLEHANAPGEANCTQCHRTYPLDSGQGHVEILGLPDQYEPSHIYPVTVRVTDPGAREWGFQITAVTDDGSACGFFQTDTLAVQALGPSQRLGRFYAEHTIYGVYPGQTGSAEWNFTWKAPSQDLGPATFYAVGNAANGDHTDFYDYIYSTSLTIDGQKRNVRVSLVAPTAGTRIGSGERTEIRWTATTGDTAAPQSFSILLSTDGGETYPSTIATGLAGDARSYVWRVPDALTTSTARVRVVAVDTEGAEHADQSRADLAIAPLGLDRVAAPITFPAGASARSAAWADVDGDGRPDAAVARSAGGALLLRQTDAGEFEDVGVASGVAGIGDARAVAWGDANGDGHPDLAVVSPSTISIYLNEGQGVFSNVGAPTSLPRPADPHAVAWSDVDGDRRQDLLVAASNGLVAVRNTTDGFVDATVAWGAPSGTATTVAAGPLVAVGGANGLTLLELRAGRFVDVTVPTGATIAVAVSALEWADVTGDGTLDLLVGTANGLTVLAGEGGDGARYVDRTADLGLAGLGAVTDVAAGDFDLDGALDLLVVAGGVPRVFRNRVDQPFADATSRFDFGADTVSAAWVDLDGAGSEDLVTVAASDAVAFTNPRSSASVARVAVPTGAIVRVDLDGDGVWATGAKAAQVADGLALVATGAPGADSVAVRIELHGIGGVQTTATVGGPILAPTIPMAAPKVTNARVVRTKLVVDGTGLPQVASMEVGGAALAKVKAPAAYRDADGTARRLVGRDPSLPTLLGAGAVTVQIVDPATGALTAPVVLR